MDTTNTKARHWSLGLVAPLAIATILALAITFTWGHESAQPAEATETVTVPTELNLAGGPGWGFADLLMLVSCYGKDSIQVPACAGCNFDKDPRIGLTDVLVVIRYQYSLQNP